MNTRIFLLIAGLCFPAFLLQAQWSVAHLSQGRSKAFAVVTGHKALFIGGEIQGGGYSNVVDVYDDSTGVWSTLTLTFPTRDYLNAPAIANGSKVFVVQTGEDDTDQINIIDTETGTVTPATLSQARTNIALGSVDNLVFFAGEGSRIDIYNTTTETWTTAELSVPRSLSVCGTIGHKLFIAGGITGNMASDRIDIYDTQTGLWDTASLSVPRSMMTVVQAGNDLVFAGGGVPEFIFFDAVDVYHAETDSWSHTALSQEVFANTLAGVAAGNKALFTGSNGLPFNVDIYDASTGVWDTILAPSSHQLNPVVANGNKVFFAGGLNNFSAKVDIYDVSTSKWSNGGALSVKRYYAAGASVGNKVLIAGGSSNSDVVDIYTLPASGTAQVTDKQAIAVFPNPADQAITLWFNAPVSGTFSLVSAEGRLLRQEVWEEVETAQVSTLALPAGVYIWKWEPKFGVVGIGKIIVEH
jgi:N-acetylneuraminic acid mutarotase